MPPGTLTPPSNSRTTRAMPVREAFDFVTSTYSDEKSILTDTPSRLATYSEGASGFVESSGSKQSFFSMDTSGSKQTSASASFDKADTADSTPATQTGVPTPVVDQPNLWFVEGQYQLYTNAKLPNDKRVMTQNLTLERQVLTGSLPTLRWIAYYLSFDVEATNWVMEP